MNEQAEILQADAEPQVDAKQAKQELKRVLRAQGLHLIEQSSRSMRDFEKLTAEYDRLDTLRERKERYWEKLSTENFIKWQLWNSETVIPAPLNHAWWRQLMMGSPLDVIFDCPHDIAELVRSASIFEPLSALNEERKELLYYRLIRQWSPQTLAARRGQSDRNIRKVYDTVIRHIRAGLYKRLSPRFEEDLPLTFAQRDFCGCYKAAIYNDIDYKDLYKISRPTDDNAANAATIPLVDVDDSVPPGYRESNNGTDGENDNDNDNGDDYDEIADMKARRDRESGEIRDEMYYDTYHFDYD